MATIKKKVSEKKVLEKEPSKPETIEFIKKQTFITTVTYDINYTKLRNAIINFKIKCSNFCKSINFKRSE